MAVLKLSSPWVEFYRKIDAFFRYDPEVRVCFDNDAVEVKIFVDSDPKAEALTQILPTEKKFGNVTLKIQVVPANGYKLGSAAAEALYQNAFKNNPALSYTRTVKALGVIDYTFIVFKNEVVQYFNDDISDINGLRSTLYEDLAREVFNPIDGLCYCTDVPAAINCPSTPSLGKPLYK